MKLVKWILIISLSINTMLASAQNKPQLIVAAHIDPPNIFLENGQFVGKYADIARKFAERLGYQARFIQCPFARCLALNEAGEADMLIGIRKNPERAKYLHYVLPKIASRSIVVNFFTLKDNPLTINSYNDLTDLSIGYLNGAAFNQQFDNDDNLKKTPITTHEQMLKMLLSGRIDVILARESTLSTRTDNATFEQIEKHPYNMLQNELEFYIAISKKSQLISRKDWLSLKLNEVLARETTN